jgi:hypothetical protein
MTQDNLVNLNAESSDIEETYFEIVAPTSILKDVSNNESAYENEGDINIEMVQLKDADELASEENALDPEQQIADKSKKVKMRAVISYLAFSSLVVCYMLRVNLSLTLIPMAKEFDYTNSKSG